MKPVMLLLQLCLQRPPGRQAKGYTRLESKQPGSSAMHVIAEGMPMLLIMRHQLLGDHMRLKSMSASAFLAEFREEFRAGGSGGEGLSAARHRHCHAAAPQSAARQQQGERG